MLLPVVKVDAFSKINASSLGRLIREVDAMLRPGGVLYVRFSIHCHILTALQLEEPGAAISQGEVFLTVDLGCPSFEYL